MKNRRRRMVLDKIVPPPVLYWIEGKYAHGNCRCSGNTDLEIIQRSLDSGAYGLKSGCRSFGNRDKVTSPRLHDALGLPGVLAVARYLVGRFAARNLLVSPSHWRWLAVDRCLPRALSFFRPLLSPSSFVLTTNRLVWMSTRSTQHCKRWETAGRIARFAQRSRVFRGSLLNKFGRWTSRLKPAGPTSALP